jgi:hypothetical protein
MARAQAALQRGEMQVMVLTDCTWMVASKSSRYTVSLDGDVWTCTCPDFTGRCSVLACAVSTSKQSVSPRRRRSPSPGW